ncbi:MAG: hypothetical protein OXI69_09485 [Acidobacteriota bacterium]|nr:hypothetical protein [Acidobacteriota bacterium]
MKCFSARRLLLLVLLLAVAMPAQLQAKKLFRKAAKKQLKHYLVEICDWIETQATEESESAASTSAASIRALLAGYDLAGKQKRYLNAALGWGDRLIAQQQPVRTTAGNTGALWAGREGGLPLNSADSCLAAAALARSHVYADKARRRAYRQALERYARVLVEGYQGDGARKGWDGSSGWVITGGEDEGAIALGTLNGQVSVGPSTASTAAGSLFFSQLYALTENPEYRRLAADGVRWLVRSRRPNGQIPSIVDGNISLQGSLGVIPFWAEAVQAAYYLLDDKDLTNWMLVELDLTIRWLLRVRSEQGLWGEGAEKRVTTSVATLLAWFYLSADSDESIPPTLNPPWKLWLNPVHAQSFGILADESVSGLVGMTTAEMIKPGITFRKK